MTHKSPDAPLPWKKILLLVGLFFFTGLVYIFQQYSGFFSGSILGAPKTVLQGYSCPQAGFAFEVSPVPGLFSYIKGDADANRREMLRINKKNQGLTSWFTYDMAFNEALKSELIDAISYERSADQYLSKIYAAIKTHKSMHGAGDFVTKWLSPDNVHLPTVFPYSNGLVIDAGPSSAGYGNYVTVCSDLTDGTKTLRVLYTVAHLDSISVTAGQAVTANVELGKIGSTGDATTPHAHIAIMPDLVWVTNYKELYNAGYKSYFPSSIPDVLVKEIDPVSVMLNPDLAYSIVLNDQKRQGVFANPEQYIAGLSNAVAFAGDALQIANNSTASIIIPPAPPQNVFTDFRITALPDHLKTGEWSNLTVEAIDQAGNLFPDFNQEITVVLSSSTAQFNGVKTMQGGKTTFQVTDSVAGEVNVQVGNQGSISEEKKLVFTAPEVVVANVQTPNPNDQTNPNDQANTSTSNSNAQTTPVVPAVTTPPNPVTVVNPSLITLLDGQNYHIFDNSGQTLIVFNDKNVTTEYPVGLSFNVPDGTDAVSIFSGINDRNFPDTGELKLSKYVAGQKTVRYFPKYFAEDVYKKIVAYQNGQILSSRTFTWSPLSANIFLDVVDGVTDPEVVAAVKALKDSGVAKGNPDGSFGVDSPINRASVATILIRAFYHDVNLDSLTVTTIPFKDVAKTAWYASAMWFASQSDFNGQPKPVIIKGFEGKANPDGNVKLEEFLTMVLRLLQIETPTTDPWYEGVIAKSIELGFITQDDRKLIDQPLQRAMVAKILVKALKKVQS